MIATAFTILPYVLIGLGGLILESHASVLKEAASDGCYVDSDDRPPRIAVHGIAPAIHPQRQDLHCKASA